MSQRYAVIGALLSLLLLAGVGAWWLNSTSSPQQMDAQSELSSTTSQAAESDSANQTRADVSTKIGAAQQRVADAKLALQAVEAERQNVEALLEQAERDVTELERFVDDIEARGEDPADYADEGLEIFQPAFYAYQDAIDQLDLVDSMHKAAQDEVVAAEKQLAETLAESEDE